MMRGAFSPADLYYFLDYYSCDMVMRDACHRVSYFFHAVHKPGQGCIIS